MAEQITENTKGKNLLSNYELIPGIAASVHDDGKLGRIKVSIPCEDNTENVNLDTLPWAYPFSMTGTYQGFTKLNQGAKVWILRSTTNAYELWYIPMFELNPETKQLISNYDNSDVLVSRNEAGEKTKVYSSASDGIVMAKGSSNVSVNSDKTVSISTSGSNVTVKDKTVMLNTSSQDNHAAVAENVVRALRLVYEALVLLKEDSITNIFGVNLVTPLSEKLDELGLAINGEPGSQSGSPIISSTVCIPGQSPPETTEETETTGTFDIKETTTSSPLVKDKTLVTNFSAASDSTSVNNFSVMAPEELPGA